jgi:diguanylate cyclase (GGDEF)-like protein
MHRSTKNTDQRKAILIYLAVLSTLALLICGLVSYAVHLSTQNTNILDQNRSQSTALAALNSMHKQTEAVLRENAWWDKAATAVYQDNDVQWMTDSWGLTTLDYAQYNQAIVIEADGTPLMAYSYGAEFAISIDEYYGPSFRKLLAEVTAVETIGSKAHIASGFVQTPDGPTIIGMMPILPEDLATNVEHSDKRYLVYSRQIKTDIISALGEAYVIPGLALELMPLPKHLSTPVNDPLGKPIAYLTWPAQLPGNVAFLSILPFLIGAFILFVLFILCLGAFARFLIKRIKRDHAKAQYDATHDTLSGLLNRAGLFAAMAMMIEKIKVGAKPTLIYLDLDGFKDVNDSYGHLVGDALICKVATKLKELSPKNTYVSRLGGDEFAIMMDESLNLNNAERISTAIHTLFKDPFEVDGRAIIVGASLGVVSTNDSKLSPEEMVRQADVAMYRAKELGRGKTVIYQPSFDADRIEKNALEQDLRETIAVNGLDIAFQPLVDPKSSKWLGVEALARWHNKRLNCAIGPDVFIPIAERSGLIEMLGLQILRKALIAANKWPNLKISVNVSPAQFRNPAFPDQVARILEDTNFNAKLLSLEITEGFFIRNPERAQQIVEKLKALGISISLDDFGAGFSSIGYLRQYTFDRLKIDRSFVSALDSEANAPSVIHATVALANAFNIPVTVEGIEREEQASILRLTGCDEFQGYLFGRPMTASQIDDILTEVAQMVA